MYFLTHAAGACVPPNAAWYKRVDDAMPAHYIVIMNWFHPETEF
jgi:hypothetical protein